MADKREVVIVGAARTPIGAYGGSLKDFTACDLGAHVVKAAFARAGVDAKEAQHLVFGNVIHTEARDMYVSRVVALNAGMAQESCAMGVNRLCGSGFQAIVSAANAMDHVFGYINFIDGSARGVVPPTNVFYQMKSRATFAPIGPYLVTADEVADPQDLGMWLEVDGKRYQDGSTATMVYGVAFLVSAMAMET